MLGLIFSCLKCVEVIETVYFPPGLNNRLILCPLIEEKPDHSHICNIPPRRVMENQSFLVDTSNLKDVNDVLADDSGSWVNNGQHRFHCEFDENGIC